MECKNWLVLNVFIICPVVTLISLNLNFKYFLDLFAKYLFKFKVSDRYGIAACIHFFKMIRIPDDFFS
jgi:hypothetical protein